MIIAWIKYPIDIWNTKTKKIQNTKKKYYRSSSFWVTLVFKQGFSSLCMYIFFENFLILVSL